MKKALKPVDSTRAFERALSRRRPDFYVLKLYIAGSTPRSLHAVSNIRAICEETLAGRYDLEVIDIYQRPEAAKPEQILVAPTLIKKLPAPVRKIIGDLSNKEKVLVGLDIIQK
jgi:circadian clock protein KaiB